MQMPLLVGWRSCPQDVLFCHSAVNSTRIQGVWKRGTWQTFLKLEGSRITDYQGWKGPGNHLVHLLHFAVETQRPPYGHTARGQVGTGTQPPDSDSIPFHNMSLLSQLSPESASLTSWISGRPSPRRLFGLPVIHGIRGNLCIHFLPRSFCRVAARDQVSWHEIWDSASCAVCKHQPLIPKGSLRARCWEESSPCPRTGQILAWRAGNKGNAKNIAPIGWAAIHPGVRFRSPWKTFLPVCRSLALHMAYPHPHHPPITHTPCTFTTLFMPFSTGECSYLLSVAPSPNLLVSSVSVQMATSPSELTKPFSMFPPYLVYFIVITFNSRWL